MIDLSIITIATFLLLPLSGLIMLPVLIDRMAAIEASTNQVDINK